jgi:hypothetical protein
MKIAIGMLRDARDKLRKTIGQETVKDRNQYGSNVDLEIKNEITSKENAIKAIITDIENKYRTSEIDDIAYGLLCRSYSYAGRNDFQNVDNDLKDAREKELKAPKEIMELVCQRFINEILKDFNHRYEQTRLKIYIAFTVYSLYQLEGWCIRGLSFDMAPPFNTKTPIQHFMEIYDADKIQLNIDFFKRNIHSVADIAKWWAEF